MDFEQAKLVAEIARVQIVFNESMNLYAVMVDDSVSYITKENFERYNLEEFKKDIGNKIIKYVAIHGDKHEISVH